MQKGNVILFPDLERRLKEKGLDCLKEKKYREAIELFEEAKKLEPENSDIYIGLILSYYETGSLNKAKKLVRFVLQEGIGDYIKMVDLYIMILVQLHEYEEIISTIEGLLEDNQIPKDKYEHFSKMLHFSRKMSSARTEKKEKQADYKHDADQELKLFIDQDPREMMMRIAKLADENIRPYLKDIKRYLLLAEGHPFLKTMLLNVLKEHEYDQSVDVEKFGKQKSIIPIELEDIHRQSQAKSIKKIVKEALENDDPILFENIKSLIERHFFLIYPFKLEPVTNDAWAAAYHYIVNQYYGKDENITKYAELYNIEKEEIEQAQMVIRELEEISYPNI